MASMSVETGVLTDVVLPAALGIIMLGMGLSLSGEDFRRVARQPRAVVAGLVGQVLILPLLAVGVAIAFHFLFGITAAVVVGLLLLACCPGGATSNLLAYLARADAALSVTLTSITSLASAILTPLTFLATTTLVAGSAGSIEVSLVEMIKLVVAIVALPVLVGMFIRHRRPAWAARAERPFRIASIAFFALVVAGVIVQNRANFWALAAMSVPSALVLNLLALGAGLTLGRLARVGATQGRTLAIEVGFQNGTLGITIAVTQLGSPEAAIVPGFYSLVMFATGGLLAWKWSRDAPVAPAGSLAQAQAPLARGKP